MKCEVCGNKTETNHVKKVNKFRSKFQKDPYKVNEDMIICDVCARKEVTKELFNNVYNPAIEHLSDIVNKMGYDYNGIHTEALLKAFTSKHRYLQSEMFTFFINFLKKYKELDDAFFDQRNIWTREWANNAANLM